MLISMVTYDTIENGRSEFTYRSYSRLMETIDHKRHRVVISDNNSTDKTTVDNLRLWEEHGAVVIRNDSNLGPARATNQSWKLRKPGEHCCKIDNDVYIYGEGWADDVEDAFIRDPRIGIIGLKRKDLEQRPGHPNKYFGSTLIMLPHKPGETWLIFEETPDIIGTCTSFNSSLLDRIGYLYNGKLKYGYEDPLVCHRAHKVGFKTGFLPHVVIDHMDPGGTEYVQWKQTYALLNHHLYVQWLTELHGGVRSVYCGPEDE